MVNDCVGCDNRRDFNGLCGFFSSSFFFYFFFKNSASMGHINTIGSLDRTSLGMKAVGSGGVPIGEMACRSMATLSRIAPYSAEAPPPYEWTLSLSVEEVVSPGGDEWWV